MFAPASWAGASDQLGVKSLTIFIIILQIILTDLSNEKSLNQFKLYKTGRKYENL